MVVIQDATERTVIDESFSDEPPFRHPPSSRHKSRGRSGAVSSQTRDLLDSLPPSNCESASSDFAPTVVDGDEHRDAGREPELAAREARHVRWSKALVALVLMVSAGLLGYFTYRIMQQDEVTEFENQVSC